jgi:hypothetical protein
MTSESLHPDQAAALSPMLTWTREGESHSIDVYERLLRQAGFSASEAHSVEGMPSQFLVAGRGDAAGIG